jgi:hypothetical protein
MNTKDGVCDVFNEKLNEFLIDLLKINQDEDIATFKNSLRLVLLVDKRKPIRLFKTHVLDKYETPLKERDEEFFLAEDYTDIVINSVDDNFDLTSHLVNKIKAFWRDLNTKNKDIIWKYFHILCLLCNKFQSL